MTRDKHVPDSKKQFQNWLLKLRYCLFLVPCFLFLSQFVFAGPQSTTYELKEYGFGSGGTEGASSTTYSIFGIAGESDADSLDSTTYTTKNGLTFTLQANVPSAPTFTNPGTNYDRLKYVINNGGNPSDSQFLIAISKDNFVTTNYIQADNTVGTSKVWQTYTQWGSASGAYVTGLSENTTYKIKVKARQGNFTESAYSPVSSVATSVPSLTFGIDSASVTFSSLSPSNSFTDSTKSTILTTSTNAFNGYIIYGRDTAALTFGSNTIANYSSPNSAPTTWTGTGFGYTTNDNNLSGGTADRFTNGGPKHAGFGTTSPGDPVADHTATILTPVSSEQFTITYRVTAADITKPGSYTTTVLYVVVPTY